MCAEDEQQTAWTLLLNCHMSAICALHTASVTTLIAGVTLFIDGKY